MTNGEQLLHNVNFCHQQLNQIEHADSVDADLQITKHQVFAEIHRLIELYSYNTETVAGVLASFKKHNWKWIANKSFSDLIGLREIHEDDDILDPKSPVFLEVIHMYFAFAAKSVAVDNLNANAFVKFNQEFKNV